jgi:hypothetical protein
MVPGLVAISVVFDENLVLGGRSFDTLLEARAGKDEYTE